MRGSPVAAGNLFFACENPLANNQAKNGRVRCALPWKTSLKAEEVFRCTAVTGVAPAGQMRRAFLYYVERERARPYQPFLHYNSWYDLSWTDRRLNEAQCLEVIQLFGRELVQKRGVRLDAFVFDDGWDDPRTLWGFSAGFPNGFTSLSGAAAKCQSAVGTWLSPYWLWYGDSVWRNGADADFCGEGSMRQRWINYRDATTQQNVVRRAPLFPLNAIMNQEIRYARLGLATGVGTDLKDIVDEFRMFFGCGTQLQELYVTPQMMTPAMWDALAEAAQWSRHNADVLVDTHWIGGNAGKSEPYGYASWSLRKGILCVRNPSKQAKILTLKLAEAFELPQGASRQYLLKSPWKAHAGRPARTVAAEAEYRIDLRPFEVCILEAAPQVASKP